MPFLWKILQALAHRRLIRSFKGLRGGYELAMPPDDIPLLAIVRALETEENIQRCALGLPQCNDQCACALHYCWKGLRERLVAMLEQNTLAGLVGSSDQTARNLTSSPSAHGIL